MMDTALNMNTDSAFQAAMSDAGLICPDIPIADGNIHRFTVEGDKNGSNNGWYVLYDNNIPAGAFGNWKTGQSETWCMKNKDTMTPVEQQVWHKQMEEAKAKRKQEQVKIQAEARVKARDDWEAAKVDPIDHQYIKSKQITPYGIKQRGETLIIPVRDSGAILHSLQLIYPNGKKRFLTGGKITGCYCAIGPIKEKLYICEGYATGATIHAATGHAVAITFNAGNLLPVSKALREKYPDLEILIAADNDQWTEGNPGMRKAREAALAINAKVAVPGFIDTTAGPTDFNDLARLEGENVVRQQLEETVPIRSEEHSKCTDELSSVIMDHGLDLISRPIALIKGKGYIATWVDMKLETEMKRDVLCVINQDGEIFTADDVPGHNINDLGIPVELPLIVESKKRLSGEGLKKYLAGEMADPVNVFERLRDYFDHFMDFDLSFSSQSQMSELSACYAISTYFTDAFPVIGYLWPNGETGSGKTHYLITMSEVAYLGQVILAGGTFSSLRDMASYGATLCFDDAEKIMGNQADSDKQALLLAGNRKGTMVTFKEPVKDRKWQVRSIHIYCPRLFSAIQLPSETLVNRSIIVPLVASGDNRKSNSDPMDHESWPKDIACRKLIDDLWMMALANVSSIPKHDRLATNMSQINGRAYQPWLIFPRFHGHIVKHSFSIHTASGSDYQ